jgi:uncharacterized protein (TIGR00251 family)
MTIVARGSGVRLTLHVRPGAAQSAVSGPHGDAIGIRLAAPPTEGRANQELIDFLSKTLAVSRRAITLASGTTSRRKLIDVAGIDVTTATARLESGSRAALHRATRRDR